jgi:SP family general alpha glucoside:H+ symporter-like MFS transporter
MSQAAQVPDDIQKTEVFDHVEKPAIDNDAAALRQDALHAEQSEHDLTLIQSLKTYHRAILWSMAISLVIIMDGYDTGRE